MSDPAWSTRNVVDGYDVKIWVQAAGATAAPGTADELGWATKADWEVKANTTETGPYINYAKTNSALNSYSSTCNVSVDVADGTDTARELFFSAVSAKSKLKVTMQPNPTTGPKEVFDQCIVGIKGTIDPGKNHSFDFSMTTNTYTHTAASA